MKEDNRIAVVIVLYNPSQEDVAFLVSELAANNVFVVDNSPRPLMFDDRLGVKYLYNDRNLGIAEAQNRVLVQVLQGGYDHVVFLDQDSRIGSGYVRSIVSEFIRIDDGSLAALGPLVVNKDSGERYKPVFHRYGFDSNSFSHRAHIISSGSCVSLKALCDIGLMDSSLFIDYVDFEWCWRAAAKGYKCGITASLSITHRVGIREFSFFGYRVVVSSSQRYFYQYRNYLWLVRKKYVPLQWKIATGVKFALRLVYFPLFVDGGWQCWQYMIKGIKEGIWKRK